MRLAIVLLLLIVSCGKNENTANAPTQNGYNSLVSFSPFSSDVFLCKSGSGLLIHTGLDLNRDNKLDSAEYQQTSIICNGKNGEQGVQGPQGTQGVQGLPGMMGMPGPQGMPGQSSIVSVIYPCNNKKYSEVLLCLNTGTIIASFSDTESGAETRLSVLPDGSYYTTDDYKCEFRVSRGTVSWNGGSFTCNSGY